MSVWLGTLRTIWLIGLLKKSTTLAELTFDGQPVRVRRVRNAKRMILRVDAITADIKLTVPPHVGSKELSKFVTEHADWLRTEQRKSRAHPIISDGSIIPYLGRDTQVCFTDDGRRQVRHDDAVLFVGGPADQAASRLERWLRAQAKSVLTEDSKLFADQLSTSFNKISIGDMKSRWGSCSSNGTLRYNWRLLMAPEDVRRYVAAHEVAHLHEMNHSEQFWKHVAAVMPGYMRYRRWLKEKGGDLMKIRFR